MGRLRSLSAALALLAAIPVPGAHAALVAGSVNARSIEFPPGERLYDVWAPASYDGSTPVPLVVDMHGYGSNKTQQRTISGMQAKADLHGFLVAYPQGLFGTEANPEAQNFPAGPSWNASDFCCGQAESQGIDDVGFLRAMVEAIAREANVDARRVYVTGLSNGGAMSHRLACEAADMFAAAAPMAFPLGLVPLTKCQPSRPISVRHYAGLTDSLVPYNGGAVFPSAAQSFAYWRDVAPCAGTTPDETIVYDESRCETYTSCADGTEISLCSILASASTPRPGHILYFNDDLDLAADAWSFLSQFQSPPSLCGDGTQGAGEECDDGNLLDDDGCDALCREEPCGPAPEPTCTGTFWRTSRLKLRDSADDADDRFHWKWSRGLETAKSEFGDPTTDEDLWLCVWADGELRSSMQLVAGALCDGDEPCWQESSSGFVLRSDGAGTAGLRKVSLREGERGKAKIGVKGEGAGLEMPGELAGTVVVQLKKVRHGACWQSVFEEPHQKNENGSFTAVGH